jgi:integrase
MTSCAKPDWAIFRSNRLDTPLRLFTFDIMSINVPTIRASGASTPTHISTWSHRHDLVMPGGICRDDDQALRLFLAGYAQGSPNTLRAYAKESMRFLLWLRFTQPGQAALLPAANPKTISAYMDFVTRGGTLPASFLQQMKWPRKRPPFSGKPLSNASRAHILTILQQMFAVLSHVEGEGGMPYCRFNPMRGKRAFGSAALQNQFNPTERGLSFAAWECVMSVIADAGDDPVRIRERWVILLLYYAFLRREEASRLRMGDFTASKSGWLLRVHGKGGSTRQIIASRALMEELVAYRKHLGLPPMPSADEDAPAIASLRQRHTPVSPALIYAMCRQVFTQAAEIAKARGLLEDAAALAQASPHWLRHTGISHAMELGVEPRYVQAQARHSSLAITALYDHKDRDAWAASMEKLSAVRPRLRSTS